MASFIDEAEEDLRPEHRIEESGDEHDGDRRNESSSESSSSSSDDDSDHEPKPAPVKKAPMKRKPVRVQIEEAIEKAVGSLCTDLQGQLNNIATVMNTSLKEMKEDGHQLKKKLEQFKMERTKAEQKSNPQHVAAAGGTEKKPSTDTSKPGRCAAEAIVPKTTVTPAAVDDPTRRKPTKPELITVKRKAAVEQAPDQPEPKKLAAVVKTVPPKDETARQALKPIEWNRAPPDAGTKQQLDRREPTPPKLGRTVERVPGRSGDIVVSKHFLIRRTAKQNILLTTVRRFQDDGKTPAEISSSYNFTVPMHQLEAVIFGLQMMCDDLKRERKQKQQEATSTGSGTNRPALEVQHHHCHR